MQKIARLTRPTEDPLVETAIVRQATPSLRTRPEDHSDYTTAKEAGRNSLQHLAPGTQSGDIVTSWPVPIEAWVFDRG
jgi:hypothetical protein